jgi:hypothetical protein
MVEQVQVFDQTRIASQPSKTATKPAQPAAEPNVSRPLTVRDREGNVVDQNVYAANIKVWNSGRREIKKDDVREQFKIVITPAVTILDATIVSVTKKAEQFDLGAPPELGLTWEHFDYNEGVLVRVVYASKSMSDISVIGCAAEAGSPHRYSVGQPNHAEDELSWYFGLALRVGAILVFLGQALLAGVLWRVLLGGWKLPVAWGAVAGLVALCAWAFYPFLVVPGPSF